MNNANGASVLFVVGVCQNAHFGFTLEGASEWLRCKALRMRAQGVYWSTWPSPNPIATKQIGYYDTPPQDFWERLRKSKPLRLLPFPTLHENPLVPFWCERFLLDFVAIRYMSLLKFIAVRYMSFEVHCCSVKFCLSQPNFHRTAIVVWGHTLTLHYT